MKEVVIKLRLDEKQYFNVAMFLKFVEDALTHFKEADIIEYYVGDITYLVKKK